MTQCRTYKDDLLLLAGVASVGVAALQKEHPLYQLIALLNEPVLLSSGDRSQIERQQVKPIPLSDEPVLLNREDLSLSEVPDSAEEDILPSTVASLALPRLQVVVDDEGIPPIDVEYTGSNGTDISAASVESDEWAIDGFEDR